MLVTIFYCILSMSGSEGRGKFGFISAGSMSEKGALIEKPSLICQTQLNTRLHVSKIGLSNMYGSHISIRHARLRDPKKSQMEPNLVKQLLRNSHSVITEKMEPQATYFLNIQVYNMQLFCFIFCCTFYQSQHFTVEHPVFSPNKKHI